MFYAEYVDMNNSGYEQQENRFDCRLLWTLRDRWNVKFWEDRWVNGKVLKEIFPRLFTISQCIDSEVYDVANWGQSWSGRCTSCDEKIWGQDHFDIQFDKRTVWERILTPHSRKMRR